IPHSQRLNSKSCAFQQSPRALDGACRLWRHSPKRIALQNANPHSAQFAFYVLSRRDRDRKRIPGIGPGHRRKQRPQKCAGTRIEPPPSLPTPPDEQPDAIAAASPPLDPPAEWSSDHGLLVFPAMRLSVSYAIRNSGVFVFPIRIAPALRSRAASGASPVAT